MERNSVVKPLSLGNRAKVRYAPNTHMEIEHSMTKKAHGTGVSSRNKTVDLTAAATTSATPSAPMPHCFLLTSTASSLALGS